MYILLKQQGRIYRSQILHISKRITAGHNCITIYIAIQAASKYGCFDRDKKLYDFELSP